MAKTMKISDEVLDVLRQSTITDTSLKLPDIQLERSLYDKVNKALVAAGGKWSRAHKAHLFTDDPREVLGLAIETGEVANIKQKFQEFFTPIELAEELCSMAGVSEHDLVLEPSAGAGSIALAALQRGVKRVLCCEIQERHVKTLRETPALIVWQGDFLTLPTDLFRQFDSVVMNPPFTGGQDRAHVRHAFEFLRRGGRLVSVMMGNTSTGTTKAHKEFQAWVDDLGGYFTTLEAGAFKESGTNVATEILVVEKQWRGI